MNLRVAIYKRDFSRQYVTVNPPNLDPQALKVVSYSHRAVGGPYQATIEQTGDKYSMMNALNLLRCPVEIYDDYGQCVWWGYIHEVSLKFGSINIGVSLDTMYNKVTVTYAGTEPDMAITSVAEDADSENEYGYKELFETASDLSALQADNLRDVTLAQKRYPVPAVSQADLKAKDKVTFICRGWWDTLSWQYYDNHLGLISYATGGGGKATIGDVPSSLAVAQWFKTATPITASTLKIKICKTGNPTDELYVSIWHNDIFIQDSIVDGEDVPSEMEWLEVQVSPPVFYDTGEHGWIYLRREPYGVGWVDPDNYYWCALDTGFAPWTGFLENDQTPPTPPGWGPRPKDSDGKMLLQILDSIETTTQISTAITTKAQFVTGTTIQNASGIYSCQYRNGENTTLAEVENLLKAGTSNDLRLLAKVLQNRELFVYEEPTALEYILKKDGTFISMEGVPIPNYMCPVAQWILVQEAVDFELGFMADPTRIFIEEAEYTATSDNVRLTPRDIPNPLDIVGGLR
jgi:hypothetical protein